MTDLRLPALSPGSLQPRVGSSYPPEFARETSERKKIALGDPLGLSQFGVNLVHLPPGCWSAQRHWHSHEDELVYRVFTRRSGAPY